MFSSSVDSEITFLVAIAIFFFGSCFFFGIFGFGVFGRSSGKDILSGGGGADHIGGHLGSQAFHDMCVNIDEKDVEKRLYKVRHEVTLEESFDENKSFQIGPFNAGISRKMNAVGSGNLDLSRLAVMTIFYVNIPASGSLSFRIELTEDNWQQAMRAQTPSEFAALVTWEFQNQELADNFGQKDCLQRIRRIFSTGPGRICCSGRRFSVYNLKGIKSVPALTKFRNTSTSLFKIFAQNAQLQLPEWRTSSAGYDWWKDEQEGGQDLI